MEADIPEALSQIELSESEIADLPADLRQKIYAAFGPANRANGSWLLIGAPDDETASVVSRAISHMGLIESKLARARSERNIQRLLEVIMEEMPRTQFDTELDAENVALRAQYLAHNKLLNAQDVRRLSGLTPANKSEPASRWKREGKVFALRRGAIDLYPAFQFLDGSPRPVIKLILAELNKQFTAWQIAFWFESGNGWLDGEEPQNCLDNTHDVVAAAKRFAEPTIG